MDNININTNAEGELIIREGRAPDILQEQAVSLSGIISAPADWYETKTKIGFEFDLSVMHVVHSIDDLSIKLVTNEHYPSKGAQITGKLEESSDLKEFGINKNKKYGAKQLAQFLKMRRVYFPDRDQCMRIVSALNNLKLKVEREIEDGNDFRGNKLVKFEQSVKTELDLEFSLSAPIFKGFEAFTFKVEILFDVTDNGATYWMESVDLKEIADREAGKIVADVLKRLEPITVVSR